MPIAFPPRLFFLIGCQTWMSGYQCERDDLFWMLRCHPKGDTPPHRIADEVKAGDIDFPLLDERRVSMTWQIEADAAPIGQKGAYRFPVFSCSEKTVQKDQRKSGTLLQDFC